MARVLGICIGASTISMVQAEGPSPAPDSSPGPASQGARILHAFSHPHDGNPKGLLESLLSEIDIRAFDRIAATGRRFRHVVRFSTLSEPEAVEHAYGFVKPPGVDCPAVVSAGGETFMAYVMNRKGRIVNVLTGNKCASGTGEFFMQQLRRMNVGLEEAARWSAVEAPYAVSGRCSVFCKSDCTHAINKGVPKSRVTAGLCGMMAGKILELLKKVDNRNIMLVGGASRNQMMVQYLKSQIPGLLVPDQAPYFEALGAALWALSAPAETQVVEATFLHSHVSSFDTLPALSRFEDQVTFHNLEKDIPHAGEQCILGLDVGSTTTKAVLVRDVDNAILASVYLQTDGDPVGASRKCYRAILEQVEAVCDPSAITVKGLGVCGSGRQIAGLHALTDGIVNEIIAHAAAAVHFDPGVDTIFEIGGQDAKYTYITAGVPSDYAMNEACSAGTGSFLQESAYETLGVPMADIAAEAFKGRHPPNFNDQCAAFIASDIKTAIHEGIERSDVMAGLVYSICMNYINRVKGNRPAGQKVFMQGGVCYNRAVPLAMAAISGKKIIVPPEPGLMGAFGAALEIKKRMDMGLLAKRVFNLAALADRAVTYGRSFVCAGGREGCDRRCEIGMIRLEGRLYPFGGACNRYYNIRCRLKFDVEALNLVRVGEKLTFGASVRVGGSVEPVAFRRTVGMNKSFLVNALYPFYAAFFNGIGHGVVLPEQPSKQGMDQRNAAFCYPAELAHGFFHALLSQNSLPDALFLPHVRSIPVENGLPSAQVCPFVQGEPFYLKSAFSAALHELKKNRSLVVYSPFLDMEKGLAAARSPMISMARQLGASRQQAGEAFDAALRAQQGCVEQKKAIGKQMLADLAAHPEKIAVVVFGRPYNAMVEEAHMGIPHKFASRGVWTVPFDFLPFADQPVKEHMYWGMGQMILKAARLVETHPQLYGVYITNFSCGPDSFLITYFRSIMGRKPSLTLELDSHTADAGIETRIEAFLDIIGQYRHLHADRSLGGPVRRFSPARTFMKNGFPKVVTSAGKPLVMTDPNVTLLIPSMGAISTRAIAAVFRGAGYHVAPHPPADEAVLKLGRANTACKECLPLMLTTGALLNYVYHHKRPGEVVVYFMPSASGPCRFGQYGIFMRDLINRLELPDVAIFSLTSDDTYGGTGRGFSSRKGWCAIVFADIMEDVRSLLLANAVDPEAAMTMFESVLQSTIAILEKGSVRDFMAHLDRELPRLARIPARQPGARVPKILLTGEIFVRRDSLSRQHLTEQLAKAGFAVVCSPVAEWIRYSDYMRGRNGNRSQLSLPESIRFRFRRAFMDRYEHRLTAMMADAGVLSARPVNLRAILAAASPHISENLSGEAILTIGSALSEAASHVCGVIAIGPFGCMPNRLSEAILNEAMTGENKLRMATNDGVLEKILSETDRLPFLAIESDGSPFPQLIQAKLEAFCQSARRLHERMVRFPQI